MSFGVGSESGSDAVYIDLVRAKPGGEFKCRLGIHVTQPKRLGWRESRACDSLCGFSFEAAFSLPASLGKYNKQIE